MQILIETDTPIQAAVERIGTPRGRLELIPLGPEAGARAELIAAVLIERGLRPSVVRPLPADADLSRALHALVRIPGSER